MAVPVRPPVWPQAQALVPTSVQAAGVRPGRNDARLAAQKAFFEAALAGKPAAAAEPEPASASPAAAPFQAARSAAAAEARAADRLPPPGSIVNILV